MKLRIYPKKVAVRELIAKRTSEAEEDALYLEAEVAKFDAPGALYVSGQDGKRQLAQLRRAEAELCKYELALIDSHGPEEIAVELEI